MKELKIDPELRDLSPPPTNEEYKQLEKNILENGFDKHFPIMEWHGYIADGHNRFSICKKHNIEPVIGTLAFETKEEVLLSYLRVNMNRNPNKPLCCYRLYQKIAEDIGSSERYISRMDRMSFRS